VNFSSIELAKTRRIIVTNITEISSSIDDTNNELHIYQLWPLPVRFALSPSVEQALKFLFILYYILVTFIIGAKKLYAICNFGIRTLSSIEHSLELSCLLFNGLALLLPLEHASSAFGSVSCLFGWMSFAFFFQSVTAFKLGSYSVALRKTIQNSFKFLPFFFMVYFGFLCSFKIRETFGVAYLNDTVGQAVKTINMMIGELDTDDMEGMQISDTLNFLVNNLIYIFFVFVMCIIVLDLFIGLEVGEIKTVIDEAETYNTAMNLIFTLKV
jgi:hypothetical protein